MTEAAEGDLVVAELVAVITAVHGGSPIVLTTADGRRLPAGRLQPGHRSMQAGMRSWVEQQTGYELGYIEQLYTFADRDRASMPVLEVSYVGLTTVPVVTEAWRGWYDYFPWEDHRSGSGLVEDVVAPALMGWADDGGDDRERRHLRCAVTFGLEGHAWLPGMALQRYELLYEAGLVPEAWADGGTTAAEQRAVPAELLPGSDMDRHHRRILATGIARLRAKIQYRPVVFELMPESFTLGQLQATVEALAGQHLHKQNFRRLIEQQELVEETGEVDADTGGRPARMYRFRRNILDERDVVGTKLPVPRSR